MEFSNKLPMPDLAIGLSLIVGSRLRDIKVLESVRLELLQCTQSNVFEKAEEIAIRYGRKFLIQEQTYDDVEDAGIDCFFTASTPMGDLCGTYIDRQVLTPKFAYDYPQPAIMKTFTTVAAYKH